MARHRGDGGLLTLWHGFAAAAVLFACGAAYPASRLDLQAPIVRWDEAIPLGNGLTGGLLWGSGSRINLSLDRGDLWDQRMPALYGKRDWTYATMRRLIAAGDEHTMNRLFDDPYSDVSPTKLPVARLVIDLPARVSARAFHLNFADAEGSASFAAGAPLRAIFSAHEPVALLSIPFAAPALHIVRPGGLAKLGYAPGHAGRVTIDGARLQWLDQRASQGLRYVVVVGARTNAANTTVAVAITASTDGSDPLVLGKLRVLRALGAGYAAERRPHVAWWHHFWQTSNVHVPDVAIQRQYDFTKYLYGAGSRRGAPPIPLQGVWTADEGDLPPWKGDFHNDLNTQMTYLAYPQAGLFDQGASFIDFNWNLLPAYERFARAFYGVPGAVVPGVETLNGSATGGWAQFALSPTMGAWVAQSFYLHWRYTMDPVFLHDRAYPFTANIGQSLAALLRPGRDGKLVLPLSTSPELFDNSLRAWLTPDSNFDTGLLRWLFGALGEMAAADHNLAAAQRWDEVGARLGEFDTEPGPHGAPVLTVAHGVSFAVSHRHFSHVIAIYPLGLLSVHDSPAQRRMIDASVDRIVARGTSQWEGYSFAWMAAMQARNGHADAALRYLTNFDHAFVSRNGFHLNGDQSRTGLTSTSDRPFTLEGNFLAMQALGEMLLQSAGGVVRVFPATSAHWSDVAFTDLRAEGGFRVSAQRIHGQTTMIRVTATVAGPLRIATPSPGTRVSWSRDDGVSNAGLTTFAMHAGETITAVFGGS